MPRTELSHLSNEARLWIFGISPALDAAQQKLVLQRIDPFLDSWAAHGTPILAGREILHGCFLLVAVEKSAETSGCSIDRMFGTLQQLERELGVSILDPNRIFFRHGDGRVDAVTRAAFRESGDLHTVVFDTTAALLGSVRSGGWEGAAESFWHRDLLRRAG